MAVAEPPHSLGKRDALLLNCGSAVYNPKQREPRARPRVVLSRVGGANKLKHLTG